MRGDTLSSVLGLPGTENWIIPLVSTKKKEEEPLNLMPTLVGVEVLRKVVSSNIQRTYMEGLKNQ